MKPLANTRLVSTLAWRYLWRNYRRTSIMLAAISIGVWAMIFMTSLVRGIADDSLMKDIQNLPGHVQIHHPNYRDDPNIINSMPPLSEQLTNILDNTPGSNWSARVRLPGLLASEQASRSIMALGITPKRDQESGFFPHTIIAGRFLNTSDDKGLLISQRLAEQLNTEVDKRVVLMSQDPDNNVIERGFRIVGVYKPLTAFTDHRLIYSGRTTLQKMLGMGNRISEVAVFNNDHHLGLDKLKTQLAQATGDGHQVLDWLQLAPLTKNAADLMELLVLIWIVVVFLALSFGLANTLIMAIFERIREIGLMVALGIRPANIALQVLMESLLLLCIGLLVGNLMALATQQSLASGIDLSMYAEAMESLRMGSTLYPKITPDDVLLANLVVIVLGLLTSLLPAMRAARLNPIRALTDT